MAFRLAVFGGGNMGAALVNGLLGAGWAPAEGLLVVEPVDARRSELSRELPAVTIVGAASGHEADAALLAVKPGDVPAAARAASAMGVRRILSVAAGVPCSVVEEAVGDGVAVVRAMPNTPALVRAGATAIAGGGGAGADDLAWAEEILTAVGTVVTVPERALDAVTGLTGSGPAYLCLVAEALVDAGVLVGLGRDVSAALVRQLFVGTARLLDESGRSPEELRAAVTSPGGTTAAGVHALERAGVRAAFQDAVVVATARSRELGAAITSA